jgi:hypothetical protein
MLQLEDELLGKGRGNVGVRGLMGRVQWAGSVGPLGLCLGIRSSPYLGSSNPLYLKRDLSIKSSKRLEGKPFSLVGRGRSPAAGVPRNPATLAAPLSQPSPREQYPQLL